MRCLAGAACVLSLFLVGGAPAAAELQPPLTPAAGRGAALEPRTVVAYYFHGTLRCITCTQVEAAAAAAIRSEYAAELSAGTLAWRSTNIRREEDRHFAADYGVGSWALVLVEYQGDRPGRWKSLEPVRWLIHGDPRTFRRYVVAEVRAFLDGVSSTGGDGK